ncbi:MAG: S1 RNA-binding domain-containing protein [Chloroflexota bacterium]
MEENPLATPEAPDTVEAPEAVLEAAGNELDNLQRKTKLTGKVIKTTLAGAVIDIGMEVPGVVHISQLQAEPVNRVEDVVKEGDAVEVWVHRVVPKKKRIELTMIKPLDLDWRDIAADMVMKGKVTRLEKFGVFVDIGAERPGLVHISEMTHDYIKTPGDVVKEGDEVEVKVLNVDKRKKQIKLSMKALEEPPVKEVREPRQGRGERGERGGGRGDYTAQMPEEKEEAVPTAMEIALREAMERSQEKKAAEAGKGKSKKKGAATELEQILSRTLQHKVKSR